MNKIKTIGELEKELKVLYAKYYQAIDKLKNADESLKLLLSNLSQKTDEALCRNDLLNIIRANTSYMNLLSLTRYLLDDIRSLKRYLQALRNTEARSYDDYDGPYDCCGSLDGEKYVDENGKEHTLKSK